MIILQGALSEIWNLQNTTFSLLKELKIEKNVKKCDGCNDIQFSLQLADTSD